MQHCINFEATVELLVTNDLIDIMFKRLADETDLSGEDLLDEAMPVDKSISARH